MYLGKKSRFLLIIWGVETDSKYQSNLKNILNLISLLHTLKRQA